MVDQEFLWTLQAVSAVATAIGVCIAATYYVITLRNTEKIRRRDMVFQKLNPNMIQHYQITYDVVRMTDWDTLEEYYKKYSRWVNPEAHRKVVYLFNHYNALGILLKDKIVDSEQVFKL